MITLLEVTISTAFFYSVTDEKANSQHPTQCTKCDAEQRFFSYRRDGPQFGTQVGFIRLKDLEHNANCSILWMKSFAAREKALYCSYIFGRLNIFSSEIYFCNCLIMQGVTRNRVLSVFTNLTSWVAFKPQVIIIIFLCLDPLSPGSWIFIPWKEPIALLRWVGSVKIKK